jgi:hypothetical protein
MRNHAALGRAVCRLRVGAVILAVAAAGCAGPLAGGALDVHTARPLGAFAVGLRAAVDRLGGLTFSLVVDVQDAELDVRRPLLAHRPSTRGFFEGPLPLTLTLGSAVWGDDTPVDSPPPQASAVPASFQARRPQPGLSEAGLPAGSRLYGSSLLDRRRPPDIIMQ